MPFPALIPLAIGVAKSPVGKAVGGFFKKIFNKKKNTSSSAPMTSVGSASSSISGFTPTYLTSPTNSGIGGRVIEKVNEALGEATKDSRQFSTSVEPKTIGLIIGGLLLVAFVIKSK